MLAEECGISVAGQLQIQQGHRRIHAINNDPIRLKLRERINEIHPLLQREILIRVGIDEVFELCIFNPHRSEPCENAFARILKIKIDHALCHIQRLFDTKQSHPSLSRFRLTKNRVDLAFVEESMTIDTRQELWNELINLAVKIKWSWIPARTLFC